MSALEAARLGDDIAHSSALGGLLVGVLAGLALAVAVVAIVGTGGVAAVAIGAGIAAAGAGGGLAGMHIGELIPGSTCSAISEGSPDTDIEGKPAARAGVDKTAHNSKRVAQGSSTVFVNQHMLGRKSDKIECGGKVKTHAKITIIGGEVATAPGMHIDEEVPGWLVTTLKVVAVAGTIVATGGVAAVAGWGVALGGLGGGLLGSAGLGWVGGKVGGWIGGELGARIGETVGGFAGGMLGGMAGARLGGWLRPPPINPKSVEAQEWANDLANKGAGKTPAEVEAQNARYQQRQTEVNEEYGKVMRGESEHPYASRERLKQAYEGDENGRLPLTFKDRAQYERFQSELQQTFKDAGVSDATVQQVGSATKGYRGNPDKEFGPWKPTSDTDFAVYSKESLAQMKAQTEAAGTAPPVNENISMNNKYTVFKNSPKDGSPGFYDTPVGEKLDSFAQKWNKELYGVDDPNFDKGIDFKLNLSDQPFAGAPTIVGPSGPKP